MDARRLAVEAKEEVIVDPDRVESDRLRLDGDCPDLAVRRRRDHAVLLTDRQDDPDLHRHPDLHTTSR
jgi:hypothetical protein